MNNLEIANWLTSITEDGYRTDNERIAAQVLLDMIGIKPKQESPFYRHVDGGIYLLIDKAKHSDDDEPHVVYDHIWPFEPERRVRPATEWNLRFSQIPVGEAAAAMAGDREAARRAVTEAKARRRTAERAAK